MYKLKNINFFKVNNKIDIKLFLIGNLFLASAPSISLLLYIYPIIKGVKENLKEIITDKKNYLLLIVSLIMIFKSILSLFLENDINKWDPSLNWVGLGNWIPLFIVFLGFKSFLRTYDDRKLAAKFLIYGTVPVIFSCFSQYFLKWFGPYETLNGLIIWFQRPITEINQPVSGLFNNPNYTGAWLSMIWPFILALLSELRRKNEKFNYFLVFFFCILMFITFNLINSRAAWLGLIISIPFMNGKRILNWYIPSLVFFALGILISTLPNIPSNIQNGFISLIPDNILTNFNDFSINFENLERLLIWKNSLILIFQKPFLGWGAASFPSLYFSQTGVWKGHPHNLFLEISISYGLIAAIILFTFIVLLMKRSYANILRDKLMVNKFEKAWWLSSFIFITLHLFDIVYFDLRISILFWMLLSGLCVKKS